MRSGPVRLTFLPVDTTHPQLAFTIGRRFGSAVERNRARRRLTEAFSVAWPAGPAPTGAYLITAERAVLTVRFDALVRRLEKCLDEVVRRGPVPSPPGGEALA